MTVNGDLVTVYGQFASGALQAFLPLLVSVIGVFLAFAILNMLRFFILRIVK